MAPENRHLIPPQYETALKRVGEKCNLAKTSQIGAILSNINQQAFNNLSKYSPPEFPGAVFPYTKVTLSVLPEHSFFSYFRHLRTPQASVAEIIELNMNGFATPPQGHPLTMDKIYDRMFENIATAKKSKMPTKITFIGIGQITGLGGKTTKELYKAEKQEGFSVDGRILARFTHAMIPQKDEKKKQTTVIFHGTSMGAVKALETALQVTQPNIKKIVEMEKPPRIPGLQKKRQQPKNWQTQIGYAIEGVLRKKIKALKQELISPEYNQELKAFFEQKSIDTKDTFGQKLLKRKAVYLVNRRNISKNKVHMQNEYPFPVNVKIGGCDPLTFSPNRFLKGWHRKTEKHGNITIAYNMSTHSTKHYNIENWTQAINGVTVT